jgi:hypothetical protein
MRRLRLTPWRPATLAFVTVTTACAVVTLAVPTARADRASTTPAPDRLWRAYPLEQTTPSPGTRPSTGRPSPAARARTAPRRPSGSGRTWPVAPIEAGAVILGAIALAAEVRMLRRSRPARGREPRRPALLRGAAASLMLRARSRPRAAAASNGAAPARMASRNGAPPREKKTRPAPDPRGPSCEVRWRSKRRGSRFVAVMVGPDGRERTVASSPALEWRGASPPEPTREAQAALRRLSKTLREEGWRPMRAKAKNGQWYARRFRLPAAQAAGGSDGAPAAHQPAVR